MREMKDSRVEWIGQIPAHWNLVRLKSLIVTRDGGAWGEEAAGRDGDMICLRIADFDYQRYCFKSHGELTVRHFKPDVIERLRLMPGDILVEKSGGGEKTPVGRAVLFDKDYSALYSNFMDRLRCKDGINPQWLLYNWATLYANNYTRPYIKQTTGIQNLDISGLLSSQFIALPSENEQEKVLSVVLNESKKVDALIANVQAQIEKLKDYKQSVITEVVTKGLDPAVPMKNSGFEWIGEIPAHWGVTRIKNMFELWNERNDEADLTKVNLISLYTDLGVVQHSDLTATTGNRAVTAEGYKIVRKHDIVVNIILCWMGAVGMSQYDGVTSPAYDIYRPLKDTNSEYYHYLFRTNRFNGECYRYGRGIMMMRWRTYSTEFRAINIPCPPAEEQKKIVTHLNEKCNKIDQLIAIKQAKIEKLEQYKRSLIYEYVTGKKEVR